MFFRVLDIGFDSMSTRRWSATHYRTRPAGVRPALNLCDKNIVRHRYWRAIPARIPAPQHQFVLADMLDQRCQIAITVARAVL